MPVPILTNPEKAPREVSSQNHELVVISNKQERVSTSGVGHKRGCAHFVDLAIVYGFSSFMTKGVMMGLMAFHLQGSAELSFDRQVFWGEAFQYGYQQVAVGSFVSILTLYFIGMPYFLGRTFGLGLFGLRITDEVGEAPSFSALLSRFSMCLFSYMALGIPFISGLSRRDGQYFHDRISETFITKV